MYCGTYQELKKAISNLDTKVFTHLLVLIAESPDLNKSEVLNLLRTAPLPVLGGVFPAIIHNGEKHSTGYIVEPLKLQSNPIFIQKLAQCEDQQDSLRQLKSSLPANSTCLTLVDGLSPSINKFMDMLHSELGDHLQFIGGGAGSLSLKQTPCLFDNHGWFQDCAVILPITASVTISVGHGWAPIQDGLVATKTDGNWILELNWRPAFEVYKELIELKSKNKISVENFFETAKSFPFGIYKAGQEFIVRDPIHVNEKNHILCVGEIPNNSTLSLMSGDKQTLLRAASEVTKSTQRDNTNPRSAFIVDCISRSIFLENDYQKELQAISSTLGHNNNYGILTLGEIASEGKGILEFYNKTLAVGGIYE